MEIKQEGDKVTDDRPWAKSRQDEKKEANGRSESAAGRRMLRVDQFVVILHRGPAQQVPLAPLRQAVAVAVTTIAVAVAATIQDKPHVAGSPTSYPDVERNRLGPAEARALTTSDKQWPEGYVASVCPLPQPLYPAR
ncbi:hypothetical protein CSHISOI_06702, partial [Colletotrichum shisoi]